MQEKGYQAGHINIKISWYLLPVSYTLSRLSKPFLDTDYSCMSGPFSVVEDDKNLGNVHQR